MLIKIVTLPFRAGLEAIDTAPLEALQREFEILQFTEHLFFVDGFPYLLCVIRAIPRSIGAPQRPESPGAPESSLDSIPTSSPPLSTPAVALAPEDHQLATALREWRRDRARRDGTPPFVIFTDRELRAIATERPPSLTALRRIPGLGAKKTERYGAAILDLVAAQGQPLPHEPNVAPGPMTNDAEGGTLA